MLSSKSVLLTILVATAIVGSVFLVQQQISSSSAVLPTTKALLTDPGTYYSGIDASLKDAAMITQLHTLVSKHASISYEEVWTAVEKIFPGDACPSGTFRGMYSSKCWTTSEQCGNYKKEGDCFNREHSWPKSWWGGFSVGDGAQTDLFHLVPADGYVNNLRGNLPLGVVGAVDYVSSNGCKIGDCVGNTGKCFEPADEFKGDLARGYFYLSVAYRGEWKCCDEAGVDTFDIKSWMEATLRKWHVADPVSAFEAQRNEQIFSVYQQNRNPFIDHPEWVDSISDF